MIFDLATALRSLKPQKSTGTCGRRPDSELRWVADEADAGGRLLLDTTVYIDMIQGRAPDDVKRLLASRHCLHSSVSIAELTHLFGRLDPNHSGTAKILAELEGVIEDVPLHRLLTPSADLWGRAGILAGLATRPQCAESIDSGHAVLLNDALIMLLARQTGASVLTGNIVHFDVLEQLIGGRRAVFYRGRRST